MSCCSVTFVRFVMNKSLTLHKRPSRSLISVVDDLLVVFRKVGSTLVVSPLVLNYHIIVSIVEN